MHEGTGDVWAAVSQLLLCSGGIEDLCQFMDGGIIDVGVSFNEFSSFL